MHQYTRGITILLVLNCISLAKSGQEYFCADSISETAKVSSSGKKLYNIGSKTNWIGSGISMGVGVILSNALFGENHTTYFLPYNYPLLVGTALLGNGSDMIAQGYSGNKFNDLSKKAWMYYWTALSLEIAGATTVVLCNKERFKALYQPTDLAKGGGIGTLLCLSSTVINYISWNKFYKQKLKTEDVFSLNYVPFNYGSNGKRSQALLLCIRIK